MTLRLIAIGFAVSTALALPAAQSTQRDRLLNTIVGHDAEVRLPPTAENIGSTLASTAKSTGALIGYEVAMGEEPTVFVDDRFAWSPRGLTLAQALDQVVAMDTRYEWRERNGVIHVRPRVAFEDATHFLNLRVDRSDIKDALPLHATFEIHRRTARTVKSGIPSMEVKRSARST